MDSFKNHCHSFPHFLAGSEAGSLRILASLCLGYGVVTALALLAALFPISVSRSAAVIFILAGILVGVIYLKKLKRNIPPASMSTPGKLATAFFYLTLILYLVLWILAAALPDFSYDGNYYHNPTIHFWAQQGGVHWIDPGSSPHWGPVGEFAWNGYPKGIETVHFIFIRAVACGRLINTINLLFLPLGFLAIISLSLSLGARSGFALAAGCLFLYLPINLAQSLTAMVDTASASCYLAFFALLIGTVKRIGKNGIPWYLLAGLGSALGLAAGSKIPGIFLIPAGGLVLLFRFAQTSKKTLAGFSFRRGITFIVIAVLIGLLLGGYWLGRNWIMTGNPLYPVEIEIAGHRIFDGVDLAVQFRPPYRVGTEEWSQAKRIISNWINSFRFDQPEVLVYDSRWGGLGFVWLLSIPAIVWLVVIRLLRRRQINRSNGLTYLPDLIFICLVMFLALPRHHSHMSRYTIWLAGLGLPCLAAVTGRLSAGNLWRRVLGYSWVGLTVLLAIVEAGRSLRFHTSFIDRFRDRPLAGSFPNRFLTALGAPYPCGYYYRDLNGTIMEMVTAGIDPVGVAIKEKNQRHLIFGHLVQDRALGRREIVFVDHARAAADPEYLPELIRTRGIRYLFWDSTLPLNRFLIQESVRQDYEVGKNLWHVFTFSPEKR